jgi:hypothetical protein
MRLTAILMLNIIAVIPAVTVKTAPDERSFSECMVRRRVCKRRTKMAFGLRQCIRPLVESTTPGHDGYPLALVPIMWTVW